MLFRSPYPFGKELGYVEAMRRFLPAFAMVLMPILAQAQGPAENHQATFRSGVDLVTVSATVRDGKGRLVKDLSRKDFEVIDRGTRRAIPALVDVLFFALVPLGIERMDLDPTQPGLLVLVLKYMPFSHSLAAAALYAALVLAMINVIFEEGLLDHEFVAQWCTGSEELRERASGYVPDVAAQITGVAAEEIRALATPLL